MWSTFCCLYGKSQLDSTLFLRSLSSLNGHE
ncbi:hypothetical protein LINPERPRIM_LOCUS4574 [Linum perenne]